ncbi:enoyl-CoA hydratase-related protein [Robertmurraya massiliosenegalensis]|uniref:enoyl-CoA hydratase/isomerase family protein n=1 Tax=Robertmurraya TaxID=2837507 RepID=UPI0039A71805
MEKSVEMTLENGVASIFLNEPNSLNALSKKLKDELKDALDLIEHEPSVKVVIFAGKGRAFCAGGDVKTMQSEYDPMEVKKGMEISSNIIERIRNLRKITVSAVQGYAAGAGMSLAIASDIVVAEENAKFVLSFKNVGLIPDLGLHYHLPRMVGEWKAKEWIWSGKKLTAQEAYEIGFVHEVVTEGSLIKKANEIANELMNGPIQSFILSKLLINRYQNASLTEILEKEIDTQTIIKGGSEHKDAVRAFFSKK